MTVFFSAPVGYPPTPVGKHPRGCFGLLRVIENGACAREAGKQQDIPVFCNLSESPQGFHPKVEHKDLNTFKLVRLVWVLGSEIGREGTPANH